jgi:hypothetical protein
LWITGSENESAHGSFQDEESVEETVEHSRDAPFSHGVAGHDDQNDGYPCGDWSRIPNRDTRSHGGQSGGEYGRWSKCVATLTKIGEETTVSKEDADDLALSQIELALPSFEETSERRCASEMQSGREVDLDEP